ncbi:MAG: copper resistance system multicopper oxidase [Acidobacteria bacterium]|nr:MAG: copper resistance system multicopper oxidase [Acidobacteriota bacterium]
MNDELEPLSRRRFVRQAGCGALGLAASGLLPPWARAATGIVPSPSPARRSEGRDTDINLIIRKQRFFFGGKAGEAITINGSVPGPLVRLREGETATLRVKNEMDEATSIHWHGILLPPEMDGVPGVSFAGIPAGETFVYRYPVKQNGTYWYHSHSGLQEQLGHYGPLIIDPAEPDPFSYDRDHVVILGDWTFENPYKVLARLKKQSNYYNFQRRTFPELFNEADLGLGNRLMWGRMRMDATDIADVTGATYTYLMNGLAPQDNWTALFRPGEKVRLRLINAAAGSFFDVRIPGLSMTVVQVDGQNVEPVTVDELRIAIAETYDVIVEPVEDRAYTIFAESMDRSGYARGTLAPREGMSADIPARRERPTRTMADMGMGGMEMGGMDMGGGDAAAGVVEMAGHEGHAMPGMNMPGENTEAPEPVLHGPDKHGPGNAAVATMPTSRLHEPGVGLGNDGRRVLLYTDLRALQPLFEHRPPDREIELHATGNMERYMWSFDGKKFSQVDGPIPFVNGERLRINFVNDTMMEHPLHLHGMWMHLDNGNGAYNPRKHTVNLKPGERMFVEVEVDAPGQWAFHCHILTHMEAGMFRVVEVGDHVLDDGQAETPHDDFEARS